MEGVISFLSAIGKLKQTPRTGWVLRDVKDPESVSDHMYRMAIITMVACDPNLNRDRCIKLCLVHDAAECIVGDIAPADNVPKPVKQKLEEDAMNDLCRMLGTSTAADEIKQLFDEYEAQETPEAIFVKDLDRFEMILQAFEYEDQEKRHGSLQEFFDGVEGKFKTEIVQKLVDTLNVIRARNLQTSL